jgi:hypothetical protein
VSDLIGCTIIDRVLGDRRGVIISVDVERCQVFVQWSSRHCTSVTVEPHRFDVITSSPITKESK